MALTLNEEQRADVIASLVTNCPSWDSDDIDFLVNMDDEKLMSHVYGCAGLVANMEEEDSGLPDSLDPDGASALKGDVMHAEDEEEDPAGDQGGAVGPTKQDKNKDQPTMDSDDEEDDGVTENEYLAMLPPRIQSVVINALNFENRQKADLIQTITANKRNRFSQEYLMEFSVNELQALAELASPPQIRRPNMPSFAGAQGGPVLNQELDQDDILTIPTLEFSKN